MPLYETYDFLKYKIVKPSDAEAYDLIQTAKRLLHNRTFVKCLNTLDEAIETLVQKGAINQTLVYTKAGILVGETTATPYVNVKHMWDSAEIVFSSNGKTQRERILAGEMQLKLIGGLTRWRHSLRDEPWITWSTETGKYNQLTGKEIKVSNYILKPGFQYQPPTKKKGFSIDDLSQKSW